jgi:hypothetical protein
MRGGIPVQLCAVMFCACMVQKAASSRSKISWLMVLLFFAMIVPDFINEFLVGTVSIPTMGTIWTWCRVCGENAYQYGSEDLLKVIITKVNTNY